MAKTKVGRPKIPMILEIPPKAIVFDQVVYWINLQATQEEVAGSFRVSVETLNARLLEHFGMNFSELRKRADGEAKLSLRRYQFKQAEKSATMAIWLGKQWLGQRDLDSKYFLTNTTTDIKKLMDEIRSEHDKISKSEAASGDSREQQQDQYLAGSCSIGEDL
jgi:hypothetical protein